MTVGTGVTGWGRCPQEPRNGPARHAGTRAGGGGLVSAYYFTDPLERRWLPLRAGRLPTEWGRGGWESSRPPVPAKE